MRFRLGAILLSASTLMACGRSDEGAVHRTRTDSGPAASASAPKPSVLPVVAEDRVVVPKTHADSDLVRRARAAHRAVDSLVAHHLSLTVHLAALNADSQIVAVKDTTAWPDQQQETYNIWTDSLGRVVRTVQVPVSESGDWSNVYEYDFDSTGTTTVFVRTSSFFNDCDGGARETSTTYPASGGRIVERDYRLTGLNDSTAVNPSHCGFNYRYPYVVYTTWRAFSAATGLVSLKLDEIQ